MKFIGNGIVGDFGENGHCNRLIKFEIVLQFQFQVIYSAAGSVKPLPRSNADAASRTEVSPPMLVRRFEIGSIIFVAVGIGVSAKHNGCRF